MSDVLPQGLHAGRHGIGGVDPTTPASIGAASASDLATETATRIAQDAATLLAAKSYADSQDGVTLGSAEAYADGLFESIPAGATLGPAKAAATSNVTSLSGTATVDGVALVAGDRVFLPLQTTASQNGPWIIAAGAWTRPSDYASGSAIPAGKTIEVLAGTANALTTWEVGGSGNIDTAASTWTQLHTTLLTVASGVLSADLEVNVKNPVYGAKGDGVTNDHAALAAAFAAGVGKTVYIPDGTYNVDAGLTLDATSNLRMSPNATVKAVSSIAGAMLTVGSISTWWVQQSLTGGRWDCNDLAATAIEVKAGRNSEINNVYWTNPTSHGMILGDPAATNSTHDIRLMNVWGDKTTGNARIAGTYGIWYRNCFDTVTYYAIIIGPERSFRNDGNANVFVGCHGFGLGAGGVQFPVAVFSENGSDNLYMGCYADTPASYGWELTASSFRWRIVNCFVFNNSDGSDNTIIGIHTAQANPNGPCLISGVEMQGNTSSNRILTDYDGTVPSNNVTFIGNMLSPPSSGSDLSNVTNKNLATNMMADLRVPRLLGFGAGPSAVAGANNGTSAPAPNVDTTSNAATDMRGRISFGSGTTPAAGAQVTVTFARAYPKRPVITIHPVNTASAALGSWYPSSVSTTGFTMSCTGAPVASQAGGTYVVDYAVIG